ncbi:MAG: prepilin-type N-terminal cleavage/methylation domain-containing protein [Armatimonadota bacterium]
MLRPSRYAFTLVELLTVVLVLTVIVAIAVPVAQGTRKTSAARACTANISTILRAEAAYGARFGTYCGAAAGDTIAWAENYTAGGPGVAPTGGLVGAPEGLAFVVTCPLTGRPYKVTAAAASCTVECQEAFVHVADTGWTEPTSSGNTTTTGGTTTGGGNNGNSGGSGNAGNSIGGGNNSFGGNSGGGGTPSAGPWSETITLDGKDLSNA